MNQREGIILNKLMDEQSKCTIKSLASYFNISERTIRYDLDLLDVFLMENKLPIISVSSDNILKIKCSNEIRLEINDKLRGLDSSNGLQRDERIKKISKILFKSQDFITVDLLSDNIQVSRGTIISDLKEVKTILEQYKIGVKAIKFKGYVLDANEDEIRRAYVTFIQKDIDDNANENRSRKVNHYKNLNLYKYINKEYPTLNLNHIEKEIINIEKHLEITFSDESYEQIVIYILVMLIRIKINKFITIEDEKLIEIKMLREFNIATKLINSFKFNINKGFIEHEAAQLTLMLISSSVVKKEINDFNRDDWLSLQVLTYRIIEGLEEELNVKLMDDNQLFYDFLYHLRPALYRVKQGIKLSNPLLSEIKKDHYEIFEVMRNQVKAVEHKYKTEFSEDEIAFFTIHIAAAIERKKVYLYTVPKVIVVCNSGIGSSQIIASSLRNKFALTVVDIVPVRKIYDILKEKDIDFIISTVELVNLNYPVIVVNPIMSDKDFNNISILVNRTSVNSNIIKNILNIVDKHSKVSNKKALKKELENYFNVNEDNKTREVYEPMLKEVLTADSINLNVEVKDWREAIIKGGMILYNNKCIESQYITEMINNVENNGNYIVIAPGIAMPHARPECGALKIGMSLITLKEPINFGHPTNDPVKLIISLSAIDHSTHLKALSELMELLANENKIESILNSNNVNEIVNIINN